MHVVVLFYDITVEEILPFHWTASYLMMIFGGPVWLYMFMRSEFSGLEGGPSRAKIACACITMGVLFTAIYSLQTYIFMEAQTLYDSCIPEYSALR